MKMDAAALLSSPSYCSYLVVDDDDGFEDGCSICLEPFTSLHPASVTKCKHEYHLHCILEWSIRRSQCPVCLQPLVLNDPASQEMVAEAERKSKCTTKRSNHENIEYIPRARDPHHDRLMRRRVVAAAATSARMIMIGRGRRPSTNPDPFYYFSAPDSSPSAGATPATTGVAPADVRSRSSDFMAFSGSLKFKLSTASVRYRESFSKGTRSLKAKIIARNDSMKELSKGVQREMSAGIAGIARLISRKRSGISSTSTRGASRSRGEARSLEDDSIVESLLTTNGS